MNIFDEFARNDYLDLTLAEVHVLLSKSFPNLPPKDLKVYMKTRDLLVLEKDKIKINSAYPNIKQYFHERLFNKLKSKSVTEYSSNLLDEEIVKWCSPKPSKQLKKAIFQSVCDDTRFEVIPGGNGAVVFKMKGAIPADIKKKVDNETKPTEATKPIETRPTATPTKNIPSTTVINTKAINKQNTPSTKKVNHAGTICYYCY